MIEVSKEFAVIGTMVGVFLLGIGVGGFVSWFANQEPSPKIEERGGDYRMTRPPADPLVATYRINENGSLNITITAAYPGDEIKFAVPPEWLPKITEPETAP